MSVEIAAASAASDGCASTAALCGRAVSATAAVYTLKASATRAPAAVSWRPVSASCWTVALDRFPLSGGNFTSDREGRGTSSCIGGILNVASTGPTQGRAGGESSSPFTAGIGATLRGGDTGDAADERGEPDRRRRNRDRPRERDRARARDRPTPPPGEGAPSDRRRPTGDTDRRDKAPSRGANGEPARLPRPPPTGEPIRLPRLLAGESARLPRPTIGEAARLPRRRRSVGLSGDAVVARDLRPGPLAPGLRSRSGERGVTAAGRDGGRSLRFLAMGIPAAGSTTGSDDDGEAAAGALDAAGSSPGGRFLRAIGMLAVGSSSGGGGDGGRGRGAAGDARPAGRFFSTNGTAIAAPTSASAARDATATAGGSASAGGDDHRPGERAPPSPPPGRPRRGRSDTPQGANGGDGAGCGGGRFLRPLAKAAPSLTSTSSRGEGRSAPPPRGGGGRFFPGGAIAPPPPSASLLARARGDDDGGRFFLGIPTGRGAAETAGAACAIASVAPSSPPDPGPSSRGGDG